MPSLYATTIPQLVRGLQNSAGYIAYAEAFAKEHNVDPEEYIHGALAPTMKDFTFQVYTFTHMARSTVARITEAKEIEDADWTPDARPSFSELIEKIQHTIQYLEAFKESDFEGREDKEVVVSAFTEGKKLVVRFSALEYLNVWALPTFWFHITTAYAILRHKGVDLGKKLFLNAAGLVSYQLVDMTEEEKTKAARRQ